jgi:hypothetical protein
MSVQEQQPAEEQTVTGQVAGIVTKNADTWQVTVQPADSQYSKNLWTKDEGLVRQMTGMIGQQITFFCRVSNWVRNDGQSVRSLWVNGWVAAGQEQGMQQIGPTVAQQMPQQPQGGFTNIQPQPLQQPQFQPTPQPMFITQDIKELRIMREAADKCAARILGAIILAGGLKEDDLTPDRLHGFMDAFAIKRIRFYKTGSSFDESDVPF